MKTLFAIVAALLLTAGCGIDPSPPPLAPPPPPGPTQTVAVTETLPDISIPNFGPEWCEDVRKNFGDGEHLVAWYKSFYGVNMPQGLEEVTLQAWDQCGD